MLVLAAVVEGPQEEVRGGERGEGVRREGGGGRGHRGEGDFLELGA